MVVEGDVGAEVAAELLLLGGATGGDDRATEGLGVLDGELSDAAGATVDEEGLVLGQADVVHVGDDGGRDLDEG